MGSYPYGAPPPSEQIWREEVLYLHCLWHKGPPRNPNHKPNSNNLGASNSPAPKHNSENLCDSISSTPKSSSENLGVSNSPTFKRMRKNKRRGTRKLNNPKPIFVEIEWPCGSEPGWCKEIGWPESSPESDQATRPAAAEGQPESNDLDASNSSTLKPNSEILGASSSLKSKPNSENLGASNPTTVKKRRKNKQRGAKKKKDPKPIVSEFECPSDPELRLETGWPESNPQSDQTIRPPTAEEQAKSTALYLQKKDRISIFRHHHLKALMGSYPYGAAPPSEQLWREEVFYLHSLWHKGPPRNPNSEPDSNNLGANASTPKPNSENLCDSSSSTPKPKSKNLDVSNPTTFKKRRNKKQRGTKKMNDPKPICLEVEWPCGSDPGRRQEIGWHESNPESDQATRPAAAAEGHAKLNNLDAPNSSKPKPISENLGASSSSTPKPNSENLSASNPTTFKKGKNKRRGAKKKKDPEPVVSEFECPCGSDPEPCLETGWPESNPQSDRATRSPTAEEQAKSTYLQQKGLQACQDFFSSKVCTDDNEVEEELTTDDINESEEFKFFMGIFTDDTCLKDYYEKNWESGEFCCLVCGGTGKKVLKRFKNCFALVQHSTTISKTKRKVAHRAFGRAICQVLGWKTHQRRSIVLSLDGPLGHSMAKAESEVGFHQNIAPKEELRDNFIDLVDDSDGEVDPKDHGVVVQKENL
ncbi:nucleolar protein dao-5-like [Macadamia integrifolia]|uniref:nucleolar protein dao-5-like n=1 Tax=Macadamia integrifolia TaxID=60698 RepID=UPI001C52B516|nr:nucleolar protein dao-5-like [Macadamia integrifolia]